MLVMLTNVPKKFCENSLTGLNNCGLEMKKKQQRMRQKLRLFKKEFKKSMLAFRGEKPVASRICTFCHNFRPLCVSTSHRLLQKVLSTQYII